MRLLDDFEEEGWEDDANAATYDDDITLPARLGAATTIRRSAILRRRMALG